MKLHWITNNIGIKLVSCIFAVLVWMYVGHLTGNNPFIHRPKVMSTKLVTTYMPIEPHIVGIVARGYMLNREKTKVSPEKILVVTNQAITHQVAKIYTMPINVTGFTRTTEIKVPLQILGQDLDAEGLMVTVTVVVDRVS